MFKKIIKWLAKDIIQRTEKKAAVAGYNLAKREIEDNKKTDLEFLMKEAIGKKIIYCSNEWTDPLFAIITGVTHVTLAQQPMLTCTNVITGEESIVHPGSFYYTDELLTLVILKLNPFERWNMSVGKLSHMTNMWNKRYPPKEKITDPIVLEDKLREVGFLFKDKATSDWLIESVSTFSYHNYDFVFASVDPVCSVFEKQTRNRIQWLTFHNFEEISEFEKILNLR
jgi:hypothetical protein